jgi:hypothetical protein
LLVVYFMVFTLTPTPRVENLAQVLSNELIFLAKKSYFVV